MMGRHIVLLGDSVLDNAAYVAAGSDVATLLRARLPEGWAATLLAVDGSVIADVPRQLDRLPQDASHLVVSVGGNDALRESGVVDASTRSIADALDRLADIQDRFARGYALMLDAVLARDLPAAVCTIYEGRLPDERRRRRALTALAVLNDRILREAFARGLPLIDLRLICGEDADYANPIEPSARGGGKIAAAITGLAAALEDWSRRRSSVVVAGADP